MCNFKYSILFILLVILQSTAIAQTKEEVKSYYHWQNSAIRMMLVKGDTATLIRFYEKAIKKYPQIVENVKFDPHKAVKLCLDYGDTKAAYKVMAYFVKGGLSAEKTVALFTESKDSIVTQFCTSTKVQKLLNKQSAYRAKYLKKIDIDQYLFFEQLVIHDQFLRNVENLDDSTINIAYLGAKMDSMNILAFYHFIESNGFPANSIFNNSDHMDALLFHMFKDCQTGFVLPNGINSILYFDSTLLEAVLIGHFSNSNYAFLVDRPFSFACPRELLYGETYLLFGPLAGELASPQQINNRRELIYLMKFNDALKLNGLEPIEGF